MSSHPLSLLLCLIVSLCVSPLSSAFVSFFSLFPAHLSPLAIIPAL